MDLHAWITQQVDDVEAAARSELEGRRVEFEPCLGGRAVTGTITTVSHGLDGLNLTIAQHGVEPVDEVPAPLHSAAAVLRRCEADRRILARHRVDPTAADSPTFATACDGCRSEWVQDDCEPFVDHINDCPELLDLAHAHGITDEELARLDRPQPPKRMADVPASLRGPRHPNA